MSISDQDRPYHHGDLRAVLLEKTIELLRDTPIETLSLRKLAREAGVSHNAPYMHFKDKEALIAAVSDQGFRSLTQALRQARAAAPDWTLAAVRMGQSYVHFLLEQAPLAEVMFRPRAPGTEPNGAVPFGNSGDPDSPGPSAAGFAAFHEFVQLVEAGREAGYVSAATDPRQQGLFLWSLLHGAAGIIRATRADPLDAEGRDVDGQVAAHLTLALKGFAP